MQDKKPVLLWKAPMEPKPEPKALLTYGDQSYAIPYTLLNWLSGWAAIGADSNQPVAAGNMISALENLCQQMGADAAEWTQEQRDFYEQHGMPVDNIQLKPIQNFS